MAESILKLRVDSQEYDNKLKRAADGLQRYADGCRRMGGTLEVVEKDTLDFVKAIGRMETTTRSAKGSLGEMTNAFTQFKTIYKQMSDAEKQSPMGKALAESLSTLKVRILDTKNDLKDIGQELSGGKFGQFGSIIDGIGQKMGINANLTELLTSRTALMTGAIGAATTAVVAATKAWADYNSEIAKQQQITTVTTGLKGADSDRMTAAARAMSKTYGVDFREAINAANTFMAQFGKTGDEAIQLLRDGMQGMVMGDGQKLLQMIQQFAPAFRDAGISAEQLVAIIHNSQGGLFSPENMNAIVMGIKNIRLMTKNTSDALSELGINGTDMSRKMRDGSMTVFQALRQVAEAIERAQSGSQEAGQVMQYVFGRQGAISGTKLGQAIAELNTNLEETKRQTGDVGLAYDDLYEANNRLEQALQQTFGYKGWEEMSTGIKTDLVTAMASVVEVVGKINDAFNSTFAQSYFETMYDMAVDAMGPLGDILQLLKDINKEKGGNAGEGAALGGSIRGAYNEYGHVDSIDEIVVTGTRRKKKTKGKGTKTPKTQEQLNNAAIERLTLEYITASEDRREAIRSEIESYQESNKQIKLLKDEAQGNRTRPIIGMRGIEQAPNGITLTDPAKQYKDVKFSIKTPLDVLTEELKNLTAFRDKSMTMADYQYRDVLVKNKQSEIDAFTGKDNDKKNKGDDGIKKLTGKISTLSSGISGITGGLQTMGVQIPKGLENTLNVVNGLISIIQGVSAIISVFSTGAETANTIATTANTLALGSLTAAMWANTAVSAVPFFKNGGIAHAANGFVPGNDHNDNIPVMVSSGELILNRAQQGNLASQLDGGWKNMRLSAVVSGTQLRFVLNNESQVRGKGMYVTTNFGRG